MANFPLPIDDIASAGFRTEQIGRLTDLIERHVAEGRYPGCQIALARNGRLVLDRTFGAARRAPSAKPATADTLWLLYSNTKVLTAATLWILAEQGAFSFTDRVAEHVPAFAANGKQDVTILQLMTHQGGFPNASVPEAAWDDHAKLHDTVCNFSLEWTPGSQLAYHAASAHWTAAVLIEAVTKRDFREVIRSSLIEPLGLAREIFVGLPDAEHERAVDMHEPETGNGAPQPRGENNTAAWRRAGVPGGGGYATARGMAAFYQMLLGGGALGKARILSPRTLAYAIRDYTGDRVDAYMGMAMHRGIGPHLRGHGDTIRGLGSFASPRTFGHGGVGSSYCWADPESGVSFAYLTNNRVADPWHSKRLDLVSNFVHTAIL